MFFCLLALVAAASCEKVDTIINKDDKPSVPQSQDFYFCAVAFDPGYDWIRDSLYGNVDTQLLLFKNHKKILTLNVGRNESDVTAGDMHRLNGGNLYTFHHSGGKTKIRRNGEDLIAFDGYEYISDFLVSGDCVYTIGIPSSNKGWNFRKDGELMASEESGTVMGNIYADMGQLCFAAAQAFRSSSNETVYRYYFYADGQKEDLDLQANVKSVHAVRRFNGAMNILQVEKNIDGLVWIQGKSSFLIDAGDGNFIRDPSFIVAADEIYAHAQVRSGYDDRTQFWNDFFWVPVPGTNAVANRTTVSTQVLGMCTDEHGFCYALSPWAGSKKITVYMNGQKEEMSENFRMVSPFALCCNGKKFCIGLNDMENGAAPVIIDGGQVKEYDFNGYFTRLSY